MLFMNYIFNFYSIFNFIVDLVYISLNLVICIFVCYGKFMINLFFSDEFKFIVFQYLLVDEYFENITVKL